MSASRPLGAVTTSCPAAAKMRAKEAVWSGLSSTISTFGIGRIASANRIPQLYVMAHKNPVVIPSGACQGKLGLADLDSHPAQCSQQRASTLPSVSAMELRLDK